MFLLRWREGGIFVCSVFFATKLADWELLCFTLYHTFRMDDLPNSQKKVCVEMNALNKKKNICTHDLACGLSFIIMLFLLNWEKLFLELGVLK